MIFDLAVCRLTRTPSRRDIGETRVPRRSVIVFASVWLAANLHALACVKHFGDHDDAFDKQQTDAEPVLLRNVMKATGCTMDQAKAFIMADEELDEECESALLNLSGKERAREPSTAHAGLCKPDGKHD